MSAERLREAAKVLRERAEAATPGPWSSQFISKDAVPNQHIIDRWYVMGCFDGNPRNPTGPAATCEYEPDATYIATVAPPFALAVADWLEHAAEVWDEGTVVDEEAVAAGCDCPYCVGLPLAVVVADAVLGGDR